MHGFPLQRRAAHLLWALPVLLAALAFHPGGAPAQGGKGPGKQGAEAPRAGTIASDRVGSGRWNVAPPLAAGVLTPEQKEQIAALEALGYLQGYEPAPRLINVTRHDAERAWAGYNFYTSGHAPEALLTDMLGTVQHRWRKELWEIWPDSPRTRTKHMRNYWRRAYLLPNGDVLAIVEGEGLIKLDKDSKLLWSHRANAHHDLHIMDDGRIYLLTRKVHVVPSYHPTRPVREDFVVILGPDGKVLKEVSILAALFSGSDNQAIIDLLPPAGKLLHTNSIEVLDGSLEAHDPAFKAGNVLVSYRQNSTIAVLDLDREQMAWWARGPWKRQHDPTVIDDRHLLIFNNDAGPGVSAILEYDVSTGETSEVFVGTQREPFLTTGCGTSYRLPNGNTLITESNMGRAFEVTPEREIVWEFYSPHRAGENDELIATLLDLVRLPPDFPIDWASGAP